MLRFIKKTISNTFLCGAITISLTGIGITNINIAHAQSTNSEITDNDLFAEQSVKDGGWQGLADILKKLEPSADTRLPLTPSEITNRIKRLIDSGEYDQALATIKKRYIQRKQQNEIGEDVQLMFLEARAHSDSGDNDSAIKIYQNMTIHYPELPEPWNNLANEYIKLNRVNMAEQALQTAIAIDPNYSQAILNLGLVRLMLAHDSFTQAAQKGSGQASSLADKTYKVLQSK